ncbi:MAG: hypothetical protein AAB942_00110 [Patescibacteria group bacterium]
MELKDYIKIISKHKFFVIVVVILMVGLASLWQYLQPPVFTGAITMSLTNSPAEAQNDDYNNYYTVNAAPALIQTFEGLFSSPNFINDIYLDAGVTLPASDMEGMAKIFKTSRSQISSSTLVVSAKSSDKEDLTKVLSSSKRLVGNKVLDYKSKKYISSNFNLAISDSLVLESSSNSAQTIILGLIGGLIIGILASFVLEYFKE